MKKILSTVVALGMVAGFAATASALDVPQTSPATGQEKAAQPTAAGVSLFSVTGSYSLAGAYLNQGYGYNAGAALSHATAVTGPVDLDGDGVVSVPELIVGGVPGASTAFWIHTFKVTGTMRVNDKINMVGEVRFADRDIFGVSNAAATGIPDADLDPNAGRQIDARLIYMEYMSPVGKIRVGRVPTAAWYGGFLNNDAPGNRIMWWPSFMPKPWSLLLFTQKIAETDAAPNSFVSDQDFDLYYAGVEHKGDMGTSALAYTYWRDARVNNTVPMENLTKNEIWAYANWKLNNFSLEMEGAYAFGDAADGADLNTTADDLKAWAFMADAGMSFGNANVGLLFFHVTGDGNPADGDMENYFGANGTGKDWNPYQILTGDYMGILQPDKAANGFGNVIQNSANVTGGAAINAGVQSLGLHASLKVNDRLTVNGIVGAAWALETDPAVPTWDDSYGWEADLGATYKLMDNLSYGVHFAYLATGEFFEFGLPAATVTTEDIYLLAHQLTMKF